MSALLALVLKLEVTEPVTAPGFLGRAVYSFLLDHIANADPAAAQQLHDSNGYKPFTCSAVMGGQREGRDTRRFTPEHTPWLRLTGLDATACAHLERLLESPPETIQLANVVFHVRSVTADESDHPWAGQTTYAQLAAPFLLGSRRLSRKIGLHFASPTTFRTRARTGEKSRSWPVPLPQWVFDNLLRRWNQFATVAAADEVSQYVEGYVAVSQYQLRTHAVPLYRQRAEVGCTGKVYYTLLQDDRYWTGLLHLLAAYSFYAGVGYQTTIGMGRTRSLRT